VTFGTFTARAFQFDNAALVAWQEDGQRTLCRLTRGEKREEAEAIKRSDCLTVRRICGNAVRVQIELGRPEAEIVWREMRNENAGIRESAISAIEWRSNESAADAGIRESAETSDWRSSEEPVATAGAEIEVRVADSLYQLLECSIEGIEQARAGIWSAGIADRWHSEESFAEWQARVVAKAGKLADEFRRMASESKPNFREYGQGGALKR
jgi:hypothetical protein